MPFFAADSSAAAEASSVPTSASSGRGDQAEPVQNTTSPSSRSLASRMTGRGGRFGADIGHPGEEGVKVCEARQVDDGAGRGNSRAMAGFSEKHVSGRIIFRASVCDCDRAPRIASRGGAVWIKSWPSIAFGFVNPDSAKRLKIAK